MVSLENEMSLTKNLTANFSDLEDHGIKSQSLAIEENCCLHENQDGEKFCVKTENDSLVPLKKNTKIMEKCKDSLRPNMNVKYLPNISRIKRPNLTIKCILLYKIKKIVGKKTKNKQKLILKFMKRDLICPIKNIDAID